jgi:hypothetical protein
LLGLKSFSGIVPPMPFSNTPNAKPGVAHDDGWFRPWRFAALLALLVLASWPQVFLGLQTFVARDFGYFSYPIACHLRESFWRGELPLWNPLSADGQPFLAQWNTQVLYPPALFYLIFPLSWSLGVFCLLHLFFGGLGMFFLARRWTGSPFAAAFAGIVFAFNGFALNSLIWPATIAGFAWMPWVVWLVERAWREGGRTMIAAAMAGALQMLSGATEIILLTWILLGALGLAELVRGELPRGKTFLRAASLVVLVGGLSAAQLLPFLDLLAHSQRQENYPGGQWPMPLTGCLNFLVPLFHYVSSGDGYFAQAGQFWTTSYYVGVATMALAAWAVWRVRCGRIRLLAALALLCLIVALGDATPVYPWLCRHVHAIASMRFPIKFVILPVFILPLLAAAGLAEKMRAEPPAPSKKFWFLIWIVPTALMIGIIALAHQFRIPGDDWHATWVNGFFRAVFLTAIVGGLFLLQRMTDPKVRRGIQVLVLLLLSQDLYWHLPQPPTLNPAIYQPGPKSALPVPRFGQSRAMIPHEMFITLFNTAIADATEDFLARRFTLFCNCNLLDDIAKCDGFFPLYTREYSELAGVEPTAQWLDFLGVSQTLATATNAFRWKTRSTFLPLMTGGQKPVFAGEETTSQLPANAAFDPRREVYLPLAAKNSITATNPATVNITGEKFSDQQIQAVVQTATPAMLVIAQTYYHPWRAYVDGQPTALWPANHGFQALQIPPGTHRVELAYEDRQFYLGAITSLTTLAGCLIFLCTRRRRILS